MYYVENEGDQVTETSNEIPAMQALSALRPVDVSALNIGRAVDKVIASINYALSSFVEDLTLAVGNTNLTGSGNALDNQIVGNAGDNTLTGLGGKDTLSGGTGNDSIDGGEATDTAVYSTARSNFTLVKTVDGFTLTDLIGTEGTDTLTNVERLEFSDHSVALDLAVTESAGATALLVGAVLPGLLALDPSKQALLGSVIDLFDAGYTLRDLSGAALRLPIWDVLTGQGTPSNTDIANYLLNNVHGQAPDAAALADAVQALDTDSFQGDWLANLASSLAGQAHIGLVIEVTFAAAEEGGTAPAPQVYDLVLQAVGRTPDGRKIAAEKVGVAVTDRGFINVDIQMRTNVPHIFAIGDIVGQPMLAHKAVHEAHVAAEVIAGELHGNKELAAAAFNARVIPSVAYTDPEVAWVGLTEDSGLVRKAAKSRRVCSRGMRQGATRA